MGSYLNFKNFGDTPQPDGSGMKPVGNFPLARQSSIYSLTFDEFQNTLGGFGKDFGSMNMDELLKNIWTAEETQAMAFSCGAGAGGIAPSGNLQRQGSITLPRTLSQKTVDEVWKDVFKEFSGEKDGSGSGESHLQQRQPTLGGMTLEEFLARAGVVREDTQPTITGPNNSGFYGGLSQPNSSNPGLALGFQQSAQNNVVLANRITENNNSVPNQSFNLPLNASGMRSSQQQLQQHQHQHQHQQQQQQQQQQHPQPQPVLPKQITVSFASSMPLVNNAQQLASPGTGVPIVRTVDPLINSALVQGSVIQNGAVGMTGLSTGTTMAAAGSPMNKLYSQRIAKSDVDTSSLSPPPYMFSGGVRGRKCGGTVEKAMERRHRRMIKNRESAARSRARKQAYTVELEEEVAKLKELNQELQKKQEEIVEMQNNQILQKMNFPWGSKRRCLRRTLTGPW